MKYFAALVFITTLGVWQANAQEPQPSPTASPTPLASQTPDPKLAALEEKFKQDQDVLRADLKRSSTEIDNLKKDIDRLRANPAPDLKTLLEKTNQRIDKIEEYNKAIRIGEQRFDQVRFETGGEVLVGLIKDSGKLKVATGLASSLTKYQTLTNPAANPAFAAEYSKLKERLRGSNSEGILDRLEAGGGPFAALASNPYVSMAFSIGSFIFSKFRPEDKKLDRVNNIACVFDFTLRTAPNLKYMNLGLTNLDAKVGSYQENLKKRFHEYGRAIGHDKTFEQYQGDLTSTGKDQLREKAKEFFESMSKDEEAQAAISRGDVPTKLATVRFQIENVKSYLNEYEALLKEVEDFYSSFIGVLTNNLEETGKMPVCTGSLLTATVAELQLVILDATNARNKFREEFNVSFLAPSKRVLYGIK